jgi:hypothetical protein
MDQPIENVCEHGDHPAPPGRRFCSQACQDCEAGGRPCSPECDVEVHEVHAAVAPPDEFDAFAGALADALRTRYRDQEKARAFARKAAGELGRLAITEVVIRDRGVSVGLRSSVVQIEIIGEVRA